MKINVIMKKKSVPVTDTSVMKGLAESSVHRKKFCEQQIEKV